MFSCRKSGTIVFAYIASTLLVMVWLLFTIQITLQENEDDANGNVSAGKTTELIRVSLSASSSSPCAPLMLLYVA